MAEDARDRESKRDREAGRAEGASEDRLDWPTLGHALVSRYREVLTNLGE